MACALSAYDGLDTARAVGAGNAVERNPIGLGWGMMLAKGVGCGVPALYSWAGTPRQQWVSGVSGVGISVLYVGIISGNHARLR
jgi:hypothetical protein